MLTASGSGPSAPSLAGAAACVLVLAVSSGCKDDRGVPSANPAKPRGTATESDRRDLPPPVNLRFSGVEEPVRLKVDGRDLGPFRWSRSNMIDFVTLEGVSREAAVTAEVLLPCGWSPITIAARPGGWLDLGPRYGKLRFLVDNRGGPEATFALGESQHAVAAARAVAFSVPAPGCPAVMKLGDRTLGPFSQASDRDDRPVFLVDPTAKRCYQYSVRNYRRAGSDASIVGSPPSRFASRLVHVLPGPIDFLFEKGPETIRDWKGLETATRTQLLEVAC